MMSCNHIILIRPHILLQTFEFHGYIQVQYGIILWYNVAHRKFFIDRCVRGKSKKFSSFRWTGSQWTLNMGHFLLWRPTLSGSFTSFFFLACFAAPAVLSPILTMLSLVQLNCFSSVLNEHFCGLICQGCSALRGSGSLRQSEGLLADSMVHMVHDQCTITVRIYSKGKIQAV